jgi:hypothetical protein
MVLLSLFDAGAAFGAEVFRQFGEGADHIHDITEMVANLSISRVSVRAPVQNARKESRARTLR